LQQSAFFVLFFVKFYFIKGAKRGVSRVSILRDDLTISFYDKNFLQNLYKIIFFFVLTSFLGHFCWYIIKIFLPSNMCEHIFIIITGAIEKKEKKKTA